MAMTFEFESPRAMQLVCGPNDVNIDYISDVLKADLAVRGNSIIYGGDERTSQTLTALLERLVRLSEISDDISRQDILMEISSLGEVSGESQAIKVGTRFVYPKGRVQQSYVKAMKESQIIFAIGPAGTGKTFLAVNWCLGELFSGRKQKIILTRPVVEAGESLGFLPGDLSQKLNPYLKPLYDSMEATIAPSTIKRLEETGQIEIAPLAYMRGRSINNACIILDEAQNTTKAQMKMFLTRLGENSCAIITGDASQIDLPKAELSGLTDARQRLEGVEGITFVQFNARDAVRSRIIQRVISAYEK